MAVNVPPRSRAAYARMAPPWLLASVLLFALASRADALKPAIGLRAVASVQRSGPAVMAGQVKHHQKGRRSSRVAQVVQKELSTIIRSGTVHGPRAIQERLRHMISIVDVDVSPDLGNARVKVSIIGDQKDKISAIRWLQTSASPIRHVLAQEMKQMRRVPRLSFMHVDVGKAVEVMVRIDKLSEERRARGELDEDDQGLDFGVSDDDAFGDDDDLDDDDDLIEGEEDLEIGDFFGDDDDDDDEDDDDEEDGPRALRDDDDDAAGLFQYIK